LRKFGGDTGKIWGLVPPGPNIEPPLLDTANGLKHRRYRKYTATIPRFVDRGLESSSEVCPLERDDVTTWSDDVSRTRRHTNGSRYGYGAETTAGYTRRWGALSATEWCQQTYL